MYRAEEDYIKTIYSLTIERNVSLIKSNELSVHFGFTDQTVNEMIKKLVGKKMLIFQPYKGISLTEKGKKEAVRLIRSHRIWEVFLTNKLGFTWSEVHEDAELLEHASSKKVVDALDDYLGNPTHCQHGNPIPSKTGKLEKISTTTIEQLSVGDKFKVVRVIDHKEFLIYLDEQGIKMHTIYRLTKKDQLGKLIEIEGDKQQIISYNTANMLFVELVK